MCIVFKTTLSVVLVASIVLDAKRVLYMLTTRYFLLFFLELEILMISLACCPNLPATQ